MNVSFNEARLLKIKNDLSIDMPSKSFGMSLPSEDQANVVVYDARGNSRKFLSAAVDLESCITSAPCGDVALIPYQLTSPPPIVLLKNCGQTITLPDPGEFGVYVLSHPGLGCRYFPNEAVTDCSVKLTHTTDLTAKFKIIFDPSTDFKGDDECDGYSVEFDTDGTGSGANFNYCTDTTGVTEASFTGELTIILKGSSTNKRKKIGFIFLIKLEEGGQGE
ncbi:uncharacterized protein LOC108669059 [Hyalella azteca]|uniref:Uncharacterized protein LOC108669059 n=1 Tax=Hyalella azteca TaxID=294128 RepID=A0A8B7NDZ7_HYAAZ|nr:uncharacterized protein LOC108669059 [Hyalella azteca]